VEGQDVLVVLENRQSNAAKKRNTVKKLNEQINAVLTAVPERTVAAI